MHSIEAAIRANLIDGRLPCAKAFEIATEFAVSPKAVREAADGDDVRICHCQLGLFGFENLGARRLVRPLSAVPEDLESRLREATTGNRLACAAAWRIAQDDGLPRFVVGCACETLDVRVAPCQLGCF